jgi:hypothetical protein
MKKDVCICKQHSAANDSLAKACWARRLAAARLAWERLNIHLKLPPKVSSAAATGVYSGCNTLPIAASYELDTRSCKSPT